MNEYNTIIQNTAQIKNFVMPSIVKNKRVIKYLYSPPGAYVCPDPNKLGKLANKWEPEFLSIVKSIKSTSPISYVPEFERKKIFHSVVMLMIPYLIEHNSLKKYEGLDYREYKDIALDAFRIIESRERFIKSVREEKDEVILIPKYRVAIEILKFLSTVPSPTRKAKKSASEILNASGLGIFVPLQAKNSSNNSNLTYFRERPLLLYAELEEMKIFINGYIAKKQKLRSTLNREKVKLAFKDYFDVGYSDCEYIKPMFKKEKNFRDRTLIAIIFLCFKYNITSYHSLYDIVRRDIPKIKKVYPEGFN